MGLRRALPLLLLASTSGVAKGQCDTFDLTGIQVSDTVICSGVGVDLNLVGEFGGDVTFQWQRFENDWSPIDGATGDALTDVPGDTVYYRCVAYCGPDSLVSDPVAVNVNQPPIVSASADPAGPFCALAVTTLIGSGADSMVWSPSTGLVDTTGSSVQCLASSTITYVVTGLDTITGCSATGSVTIEVVVPPAASNSGDVTFCASDVDDSITFVFDGDGPWDVTITGQDTTILLTDQTDSSFVLQDPDSGTYQVTVLTSETCPNEPGNNGGPLVVTVNAPPSQATIDQAPDNLCQNTTGVLVAFAPDTGSGAWSQTSGPPVQLIPQSDVSVSFAPTGVGTYEFLWTVSNAPCDSSTASVTVNVTPGAPLANAGPPVTLCSGADATLQANAASPGTGAWTIISSPPGSTATFSTPADPHATFTPSLAGVYQLQWTISNPPCDPSDSSVVITVVQTGSTPSILGLDDESACDGEYQTLMIQDPINGTTYSWACDAWEAPVPDGTAVTVHWAYGEDTLVTITVTPNGPCQVPSVDSMHVSPALASCPKGIVYFEPHGLAILDETANYFQWGTLDDSRHFVPVDGWDAQTTFIPGLTNCDSSHYVVRTSIDGVQCWSTTVSCATADMLDRPCPGNGGMVQEPHLRVFPNPSSGGPVTLEASGSDGALLNIDVADLNGRTLSQGTLRMNGVSTTTLDLGRLDRGIHVLRAWNDVFDRTIKLVID